MNFQMIALSGISLFLPIIRDDLGLSFTQCGTLSASTIFVYALMQLPAGYLADRYGLKKIFFIGALGTTVLAFTFGLVFEYWQALVNQALSGLFRSFMFASGLALLVSWFGPSRRATAMALSLMGPYSGQLITSVFGPSLVELFNWRFPFISFSSLGILAAIAYLWIGEVSPGTETTQKVGVTDVLRLFGHRFMWVCAVIQYVRLSVMMGVTFWLPSLLIGEKGISLQVTGFLIALCSLLTAPSNIVGGYFSDRLKKPTLVIGVSLIILAVTAMLLVRAENVYLIIALIVIHAIFVQFYFGPLFAVPVERYGTHMTGTLMGFSNFFANLGGFTFTYLLGVLKDHTGYFEWGFYAIAMACIIGLVFTVLLEKMRRGAARPENIGRSRW
jgi:nitrate/nitrite transporter NarK